MADLSNHQVIAVFWQVLANGQDLADKANALMAALKVLVTCIAYLRALAKGKSQEEAKEIGHTARSDFYTSMRAIQESSAEGILHPTLQSTVDECTAAMENCTTTQGELVSEVQELVAKVHTGLPVHLKAQEAMCLVTKDLHAIVTEHKELLPELFVLPSETLEDSKARFDGFYTEVECRMSLAEPIYAAVREDVERWMEKNPL
jgi:hypothetical protein